MIGNLREKLRRFPLRTILIFFVSILFVGYYRHGSFVALWVLGWASYFAARFIITIKRKVDNQLKINPPLREE